MIVGVLQVLECFVPNTASTVSSSIAQNCVAIWRMQNTQTRHLSTILRNCSIKSTSRCRSSKTDWRI